MSLSNKTLYHKHDMLKRLKVETYDKIYSKCKRQIILTSNTGQLSCFFRVPSFLLGSAFPSINVKICADYVMDKLAKDNPNIVTKFYDPDIIYIDWEKE